MYFFYIKLLHHINQPYFSYVYITKQLNIKKN